MKLKSFGCSFIFGTDLDDAVFSRPPVPSNQTWPARLAQNFGYDYECLARPGSGNLQIAERILSHAATSKNEFFVIGWTWIDRFDYINSNISNDPVRSQWNNWETLLPTDTDSLATVYYKELNSEFRDKLSNLISIKLTIDTLKQKNISFLMTYMDDLLFDQKWNHTPAVIDLQNFIKPYMSTFDGKTFLEWSRSNGYPEGPGSHPLEAAHAAAADFASIHWSGLL